MRRVRAHYSGRLLGGAFCLIVSLHCFLCGAASHDSDLQKGLSVYRRALRRFARAESLLAQKKREEALGVYVELHQELEHFKRANPLWNNAVTNQKINYCRTQIRKLMKQLGKAPSPRRRPARAGGGPLIDRARALEKDEITLRKSLPAAPPVLPAQSVASRQRGEPIGGMAPARSPSYSRAMGLRDSVSVYEAAKKVRESGQEARALMLLDDALKLNPELREAYVDRAAIYLDMEKYDSAADDYRKAITLGESGVHTRYGLGTAYEKQAEKMTSQGNREKAAELYRDAVEEYKEVLWQDHKYAPAYYSLGCAYSRLDRREDALHYFRKAVDTADRGSDLARKARYNLRLLGGY